MELLILKYELEKYITWRNRDIDAEEFILSVLFAEGLTDGTSNEEKFCKLLLKSLQFNEDISEIRGLCLESFQRVGMEGNFNITFDVAQWWGHEERDPFEQILKTVHFRIDRNLKTVEFIVGKESFTC
jgi:hypothetical protein